MSLFTRSVSLVLVLPLVLRQFPEQDAAVWFVFSAVLALQAVLGFGFSPSFARLIAYARAGAEVEDMLDLRRLRPIGVADAFNWRSIGRLVSCMRRVYAGLTIVSMLLLATLGTAAVWRPIAHAGHRWDIWTAWGIITVISSLSFWNLTYITFLLGMDFQTAWRRAETFISLGAIFTSFTILLCGGHILALVLGNQVWALLGMGVYRSLCWRLEPERMSGLGRQPWEPVVFRAAWSSAWKSGITNIMTYGLVQSTGVIQAQFGSPTSIVTYNFTLRVITAISQVVQAPFNTKIPELARRRAAGDLPGQVALIRRGIGLTHWSTVVTTTGAAVVLLIALPLLHVRTLTFDPLLWALFSTNVLLERHGGMLHQVRNLTNQPMEHIGMVGFFSINVTLMLLFHSTLGIYSYPAAMVGAQLLFAVWFNARIAYPVIGVRVLAFERTLSIPPLLVQLAFNIIVIWLASTQSHQIGAAL